MPQAPQRKFGIIAAIFLIGGVFLLSGAPKPARAYGDYNKEYNGTLESIDWNNLPNDFLKTWTAASATGPIGINTAAPASGLKVNGPVEATSFVGPFTGTINAGNVSAGEFGSNTGGGNFIFGGTVSGNVGIGTTAPRGLLQVAGDLVTSNSDGTVRKFSSSISSTQSGMIKMGELTLSGNWQNLLITGKIYVQAGGESGDTNFSVVIRSDALPSKQITWWQEGTRGGFYYGIWPELKVYEDTSSGRVVIGFQPTATVQSFGWDITLFERGNYDFWQNEDSYVALETTGLTAVAQGSNNLIFNPGGNVGIGTTNPLNKVQVEGSIALASGYNGMGNGVERYIGVPYNGATWTGAGSYIGFAQGGTGGVSNDIRFYTHKSGESAGERMRVSENGNVGIGTTAPGSTLDVGGTSNSAFIQNLATWGLNARTQGLIIIPEGDVKDDGAGNLTLSSTVIIMNPLSGSWERVAAGTYALGGWGSLWAPIPPAGARGTTVTPTVIAWSDTDRNYDSRDRVLLAQRNGNGYIWTRFDSPVNITGSSGSYFMTGNVGIGTTNPAAKLEVNANNVAPGGEPTYAGALRIRDAGGVASNIGGLEFLGSNYQNGYGWRITAPDADGVNLHFQSRANSVSWTERMIILANGNVGIGTTTPPATLSVNGPVYLEANVAPSPTTNRLYNVGGNLFWAGTQLNAQSTNYWSQSSSYLSPTNTSWKVGVGVTNPAQKLTIEGTSVSGSSSQSNISAFVNNGLRINGSKPVASQDAITYQSGSYGGGAAIAFGRGVSYDTFMSFYTNSTSAAGAISERMRLISSGNLGIGTTTPGQALSVNGRIRVSTLAGSGNRCLYTNGSGDIYPETSDCGIGSGTGDSYWALSGSDLYASSTSWEVGVGTTTPNSLFQVGTNLHLTTGGTIYNADNSRYLDLSGVLGTSLEVNDDIHSTAGALKMAGTDDSYVMGQFGVGTTTPNYNLDIISSSSWTNPTLYINAAGANTAVIKLNRASTNRWSAMEFATGGVTDWHIGTAYNGGASESGLAFSTDHTTDNSKMYISTGGNVGIGTTTPFGYLTVSGVSVVPSHPLLDLHSTTGGAQMMLSNSVGYWNIANGWNTTNDFSLTYGSNISAMTILTSGNVGIGTTTPAAKLTVYGNGTLAANFDNGGIRLNNLAGGGDRCLYVDTNGDIQPAGGACGTASSTGITNLNTLTASTQTFATGTGGTDFNIVSGVSTHTFNIPDAGSGARGLVTTSAQTFGGAKTFNNNVITNAQFLGTSTDTISNPSFSWNGETNTGIYHPAVSQIALTLGGTRRALFTATGLTFTGQTSLTASSLNTLTTASSVSWAGATTLTFTADNATINGSDVANGNLTLQGTSNGTKTTSYLLLQPTGGLVGIGTTTPAQKLDVYGGNIFINDAVITSDTPKAAITKEYFDSALNAYWGLSGSNLYAAATTYNVGIGTTNPLARLQVTGGLILNHTGVADANYTASTTDYIIAYTSLTTNRTVTLPNSLCTPGRFFVVLDESGNASASKKITIDPEGATTVIGQATFSLQAPYNSVYVFCGNSAWFVL